MDRASMAAFQVIDKLEFSCGRAIGTVEPVSQGGRIGNLLIDSVLADAVGLKASSCSATVVSPNDKLQW